MNPMECTHHNRFMISCMLVICVLDLQNMTFKINMEVQQICLPMMLITWDDCLIKERSSHDKKKKS